MPIIYIHSGYFTNAVVKCLVTELSNVVQGPTAGQGADQQPGASPDSTSKYPCAFRTLWWHAPGYLSCRLSVGQRPNSWWIPHFRAVAVAMAMAMTAFPNLRLSSRDLKLSSSGLNAREHPAGAGKQSTS